MNAPASEYRRLDGLREYDQAIATIIGLAHHQLRIFDRNLRNEGYNSRERIESLERFLLASRTNRLTIVLHDIDYLTRECPRMMDLLKRFGHAIGIYQTGDEARNVSDPFIVADDNHYLHRFHIDQPRAALGINDPEGAQELARRFDEIMTASEPAAPPTTLGL